MSMWLIHIGVPPVSYEDDDDTAAADDDAADADDDNSGEVNKN